MPGSAYVCCLCGADEFGYGNNPAPLDQMPNRCCDACNYTKVIPARMEMMFAENRGFSSEDSQDEAAAAIIGGIFTVSMGALLEQLAKALNDKDAPAATFFKDCIDYMAMSMVSSYEENTKNFPKEVKYAIDMTLGMTAKQFSEWEQDPSFEELTNLGSSENPDVETMSEVVLDEAKDGYDDDFSVMYSAESEYENHIQEAFYEDKLEDGTPQWTFLYRCNDCGSLCVANDTGRMDESEFCSDGGEDHDMEIIEINEDEEDWGDTDRWNFYHFQCDCGTWNVTREDDMNFYLREELEYDCDGCESSIAAVELKWLPMSESEVDKWILSAESFSSEGKSFFCDACEETLPLKLRNRSLKVTQEFGMGIGDICRPCVKRIKQYDAESYADFFSQIEELLDSTAKDGNWMLDATTNPKDPDSVMVEVEFTPKDPSTFFDIIE